MCGHETDMMPRVQCTHTEKYIIIKITRTSYTFFFRCIMAFNQLKPSDLDFLPSSLIDMLSLDIDPHPRPRSNWRTSHSSWHFTHSISINWSVITLAKGKQISREAFGGLEIWFSQHLSLCQMNTEHKLKRRICWFMSSS